MLNKAGQIWLKENESEYSVSNLIFRQEEVTQEKSKYCYSTQINIETEKNFTEFQVILDLLELLLGFTDFTSI